MLRTVLCTGCWPWRRCCRNAVTDMDGHVRAHSNQATRACVQLYRTADAAAAQQQAPLSCPLPSEDKHEASHTGTPAPLHMQTTQTGPNHFSSGEQPRLDPGWDEQHLYSDAHIALGVGACVLAREVVSQEA